MAEDVRLVDGKVQSDDKRLERALEGVRANRDEAVRFAQDPEAYLKAKGVETDNLKFGRSELSDAQLESVAGGAVVRDQAGICGSVGCVGCVTAGN